MRAILTYHSIDESGSPISVDPAAFEHQLMWLVSGAVKVVPLAELVSQDAPSDAVALTFDDGFANFATEAYPRLEAHGLTATVFVVSDHVGGTNAWNGRSPAGVPTLPLMDWVTLGRIAEAGIELGGHTRRHPRLSMVSGAALDDELGGANGRMARELGRTPDSFAYPYGDLSDAAVDAAKRHYRRACTTEHRWLAAEEDAFRLPRLEMFYFRDPGALERFGSGAFRAGVHVRRLGRALRGAVPGRAAGGR